MSDENKRFVPRSAKLKNSALKTPHEHDVTSGVQCLKPRPKILQAFKDIESGQLDTDLHGDRGVEQAVKSARSVRSRKNRDNVTEELSGEMKDAGKLEELERLKKRKQR